MTDQRPVHRVNVNFSEGAYAVLQDLASRTERTISQVLRDAIGLAAFFDDVTRSGGRVFKEKGGTAREVVFL
jgi:hypothetical protein